MGGGGRCRASSKPRGVHVVVLHVLLIRCGRSGRAAAADGACGCGAAARRGRRSTGCTSCIGRSGTRAGTWITGKKLLWGRS